MDTVARVAGVALGVTFLAAGAAKIAAGARWPEQARSLRAPAWVVPLLPLAEVVLGALLVVGVWPVATGLAALLLLASFTVLLVRRLAAGEHPVCACFGAWSASPIGIRHVVRNVLLAALAVVVVIA